MRAQSVTVRSAVLSAALAAAFVLPAAPAAAAPRGLIAGRVVDARGAPLGASTVNGIPMSGDGRFEATVPMGDSRLVFGATGLAPVVLVVHATERGTSGRRLVFPDIVLGAGVDLIGEVVDARTGEPVMAALAVLAGPSDLQRFASAPPEQLSARGGTGYGGAYLLRRAAKGEALLVVTHPDYLPATIPVRTSDPLPTVRLQRGGIVAGVVHDADGRPVPRATVVAVSAVAADGQEVSADEEGRFRLGRLRPGAYAVVAHGESGVTAAADRVQVDDGATTRVELAAARAPSARVARR